MIFNHMPDWIYASKDLSASAKLLMQRIFTLSKDGTQHVFVKREVFAKCFGMSVRTVSSAFKELVANGLLEEVTSINKWDRTKNFMVTVKACKDENLEDSISSDKEKIATSTLHGLLEEVTSINKWDRTKNFMVTVKACKDENLEDSISSDKEKIATSTLQNLQDREGKNCNIDVAKNCKNKEKIATSTLQNLQDLHQIDNKKEKKELYIYSEPGKNCNIDVAKNCKNKEKIATSTLQNLQDLHQIDNKKEKKELYIYSEPHKQLPVSKVIKTIDYPQTAEDCEPLFESYIAKYQKDHPALMNLPVSMEAEKFFLYWSEKDWKRGKTKIKSLAGCVATWVGNWLDRNERRYPKPLTPKTIEQEIASYQAYGDEFSKFMEKRQGKTELSFEDFQIVAG